MNTKVGTPTMGKIQMKRNTAVKVAARKKGKGRNKPEMTSRKSSCVPTTGTSRIRAVRAQEATRMRSQRRKMARAIRRKAIRMETNKIKTRMSLQSSSSRA
ncbi:hypothetical protein KEM55_001870 [Ascosphaera atra]|nr:hypothetical protein KEM55_001870 [Ascosphaera atra]